MPRFACISLTILGLASTAFAQAPLPAPAKAKAVAIVNGREIPESAAERALKPIPKENRDKARPDIIKFLIDNALVDQYLELLKVAVEPAEIEAQLQSFKKDLLEAKQDYAKALEKMEISEAELKVEIQNQLRWEKFVAQQGTDEKLRKLFDANPEIFDGSMVKARHILITPETNDEKGKAAALKKTQEIKAAIDVAASTAAAAAIAKLPANALPLEKEKAANQATDDTFSAAAKENSSCPSKRDGGSLVEFPRMGMMVEPFAKAAFALKPHQISEPVATQFGYHLILVTNHKAGEPVQFEIVKGAVLEVYGSRLREAVIEKMKADPNTKIDIVK
jgi:peptidyl-prolyl cis-trans isomerase C